MSIMTRSQRLKEAAQPIIQPTSLPAPIKGWNTRDALDAMDPQDAVLMDNLYSDGTGVQVRNGYVSFAIGVGTGPVKTLAEYNAAATRKLLAAGSGKIYNVSSGGTIASPLKSGFTNDAWQWVNFLSHMFLVNGSDTLQVFDGTALADGTFTGVAQSTLVGVQLYQQRLYFWQSGSTGFWYAQLNSISGALAFYDLAAFVPEGGNLIAVTTISNDGGAGVQDIIVFVMSSGVCIMFFGNDPSNANAWQEIARYRISPPVSPRAVCTYGAESFLTTFDDHVPLHQEMVALKLGQLPPRSKASGAVAAAVAANPAAFGWQAIFYPKGRRLLFNIPNPDGTFNQHVQNTSSADLPWQRFVNMNAFCWGLYNDGLYFGAQSGNVYLADTGSLDLASPIAAVGQQAWNTFQSPLRKQVTAVRPVVQVFQSQSYTFTLGFDYGTFDIPIIAATMVSGSPWDISPWDTSPWSTENVINPLWHAGGGSGVAIGMTLSIAATQPTNWLRTDVKYQPGNAL